MPKEKYAATAAPLTALEPVVERRLNLLAKPLLDCGKCSFSPVDATVVEKMSLPIGNVFCMSFPNNVRRF
jgi:hypothetical protein